MFLRGRRAIILFYSRPTCSCSCWCIPLWHPRLKPCISEYILVLCSFRTWIICVCRFHCSLRRHLAACRDYDLAKIALRNIYVMYLYLFQRFAVNTRFAIPAVCKEVAHWIAVKLVLFAAVVFENDLVNAMHCGLVALRRFLINPTVAWQCCSIRSARRSIASHKLATYKRTNAGGYEWDRLDMRRGQWRAQNFELLTRHYGRSLLLYLCAGMARTFRVSNFACMLCPSALIICTSCMIFFLLLSLLFYVLHCFRWVSAKWASRRRFSHCRRTAEQF